MQEHKPIARLGHRDLSAWVGGAESRTALIFHAGTPFPPVKWDSLDVASKRLDVRLIAFSRPGYSGSTRQPGRSVVDCVEDIGAVLDALTVRECISIGHSGGGAHALACGALMPDRCRAVATLGCPAPLDADQLEWTAGMARENTDELKVALQGEATLKKYLSSQSARFADITAEGVAEAFVGLASPIDRSALKGELADVLARSLRRTAHDGLFGWVDDDLAFVKPWGFDISSIAVPVHLWHGAQDLMIPATHGEWLHTNIKGSRFEELADCGHISILGNPLKRALTELLTVADLTAS